MRSANASTSNSGGSNIAGSVSSGIVGKNSTSLGWEELRKEARHLESDIDRKLIAFSRLGSSLHNTAASASDSVYGQRGDQQALLGGNNSDHVFESMSLEIERLIEKLSEVNEAMLAYSKLSTVPNSALSHVLQRHRDILGDYTQEFYKTRANIMQSREREDLLNSVRRDISSFHSDNGGGGSGRRRGDLYLKEHQHVLNSHQLADESISIAIATKDNLMNQRASFNNITGRVSNVFNRFPIINSLMQRINIRKRRDAIILGSVISICIIILLVNFFR